MLLGSTAWHLRTTWTGSITAWIRAAVPVLPTATASTSYSACFAPLATGHSSTAARAIAAEAAAAAAAVSAVSTAVSTDAARATATAACTLPGAQLHVRRRTMRRSAPRPLAFAFQYHKGHTTVGLPLGHRL